LKRGGYKNFALKIVTLNLKKKKINQKIARVKLNKTMYLKNIVLQKWVYKLKKQKTHGKSGLRQNEKNEFSFCRILKTNRPKWTKFGTQVIFDSINLLSKFRQIKKYERANDSLISAGLTQLYLGCILC
jgi:hypothetical protein